MKNTCLYSFYEYIFKYFIAKKKNLPEYEDKTDIPEVFPSGVRVELDKRKKYIWQETRRLQEIRENNELTEEFRKLKNEQKECSLCLSCEQCEKYFWEQLERAFLLEEQKDFDEKCEFLIPDEVNRLMEQKDKPADMYIDFYKRRNLAESNYLLILKGFSSSTPILLNYAKNTNMYAGGGFYIRWNGYGIAVDPGYLFVQNLHNCGLTVFDIDAVIVTHEHIDHSSDIRILDDLHYSVASKYKEENFAWNNEEFSISKEYKPKHKIKWYLDKVSYEQAVLLSKMKSGFDLEYNELYCIKTCGLDQIEYEMYDSGKNKSYKENSIKLNDSISVKIFPTKHEQYEKDGEKRFHNHTFGCIFECHDKLNEKRVIGYTSDTSIQEDVSNRMFELLKECQVIISNISGIYKEDILLKEGKERHLGYYGCYKIINKLVQTEDCRLRYFLISEFSNMVSDIRYEISKYMQKEVNQLTEYYKKERIAILPAEIGLIVNLSELKTKCTLCNGVAKKIHVLKPVAENNKLQYVCEECMYSYE